MRTRTLVVTLGDGGATAGIAEGAEVEIRFARQLLVPPSTWSAWSHDANGTFTENHKFDGVGVGTSEFNMRKKRNTTTGMFVGVANITTRSHTPPFLRRSVGPSSREAAKLTVEQLDSSDAEISGAVGFAGVDRPYGEAANT